MFHDEQEINVPFVNMSLTNVTAMPKCELVWIGKCLTCSFWLNTVVSLRNMIKELHNYFFLFFLRTFYHFSRNESVAGKLKLIKHQKYI